MRQHSDSGVDLWRDMRVNGQETKLNASHAEVSAVCTSTWCVTSAGIPLTVVASRCCTLR